MSYNEKIPDASPKAVNWMKLPHDIGARGVFDEGIYVCSLTLCDPMLDMLNHLISGCTLIAHYMNRYSAVLCCGDLPDTASGSIA